MKEYLKNGFITVDGIKIEQGWLKIENNFNDTYEKSKEFACSSNMTTSVMLKTTLDPEL